ncbi:MAG: hypothetical protein ACLR23_19645 [Clostridia bacterium]
MRNSAELRFGKRRTEWYQANKETLANFVESYDAYKSSLLQNSVLE